MVIIFPKKDIWILDNGEIVYLQQDLSHISFAYSYFFPNGEILSPSNPLYFEIMNKTMDHRWIRAYTTSNEFGANWSNTTREALLSLLDLIIRDLNSKFIISIILSNQEAITKTFIKEEAILEIEDILKGIK